ncbi:MAG: hypothetical protein EOP39_10145 [Rubrivivax sp.]|nr:MAG: hypothetical protein EOP39_10145 [Rubrivivax sp.]
MLALRQRGDVRSLAVAEFLDTSGNDAPLSRARLQAIGRSSNDPMITALALLRPCAPDVCSNVEVSQWSRLEPANLNAWRAMLDSMTGRSAAHWAGYVLDRMGREGRYSRSYQKEFREAILGLPQTDTPGLASQAETQLLVGILAAWPIPRMSPLTLACGADPSTAHRCATVAELLWQQDDLMDHLGALGLVRRILTLRPDLRDHWEPRARELEALRAWQQEAPPETDPVSEQGLSLCEAQFRERKVLLASIGRPEWGAARAEMKARGADDAALSANWRRMGNRAVLDPLPAAPPR